MQEGNIMKKFLFACLLCWFGISGVAWGDDGEQNSQREMCEAAAARGEPANWNNNMCNCGDLAVWDAVAGKCRAIAQGVERCYARCVNLTGDNKVECRACCEVNKNIATWEKDPDNPGSNYCKCVQEGFRFDVMQKVCLPAASISVIVENNDECSEILLVQLDEWAEKYSNNTQIIDLINQIRELCGGDPINSLDISMLLNNLYALINDEESSQAIISASTSITVIQQQLQQKIDSAVAVIENAKSNMKLTVWRNDEGKFNTSRLLSDSIAGVVLGTAGGLITSNVVKKNQVEDGFEDLQCTVGGQVVAGWGDEFRVGIQ